MLKAVCLGKSASRIQKNETWLARTFHISHLLNRKWNARKLMAMNTNKLVTPYNAPQAVLHNETSGVLVILTVHGEDC